MKNKIRVNHENELMEGEITELSHHLHIMYHIAFSNGYENIFFTDAESGEWVEEDLGFTSLAASVGETLTLFSETREKRRVEIKWYHENVNDQPIHFGYHQYWVVNWSVFEIFAPNKRFLFTLIKIDNTHWQLVYSKEQPGWEMSAGTIHELPQILEEHIAQFPGTNFS